MSNRKQLESEFMEHLILSINLGNNWCREFFLEWIENISGELLFPLTNDFWSQSSLRNGNKQNYTMVNRKINDLLTASISVNLDKFSTLFKVRTNNLTTKCTRFIKVSGSWGIMDTAFHYNGLQERFFYWRLKNWHYFYDRPVLPNRWWHS